MRLLYTLKHMTYTYLHKKFCHTLQNIIKYNYNYNILIALSGGQDSLCITQLIHNLLNKYQNKIKIEYIYIDHQWRKDSKQHIQHLINFIQSTNNNISIYEIYENTTSELEARICRYKILINHALKYNHNIIMTGHTKTDQIETFLHHLIRGTTIDGATSLNLYSKLSNQIYLLRPLINFNRHEISWLCRKYYLPIWSDSTNYKYNNQRNRIRHELIPYLRQYFNKNISESIISFINITRLDNEYLKQNTIKLYLLSIHPTNVAINYKFIYKQHKALRYRTIQLFFYYHFNTLLNLKILQSIILYIHQNNYNHYQIQWNNFYINIYNNWLYINIK